MVDRSQLHNDVLFLSDEFTALHKAKLSQKIVREYEKNCIIETTVASNDHNECIIPIKGTFGGLKFSKTAELPDIIDFVGKIVDFAIENKLGGIEVKLPPAYVGPEQIAFQKYAFYSHGFSEVALDLTYYLPVSDKQLLELMNYGNRKRYNKCLKSEYFVRQLDPANLAPAYDVIQKNREANGHKVSMTLEQLCLMERKIAGSVVPFACYNQHENCVASAVCINISDEILYVLYWGELHEYRNYSPVAFLAHHLYEHARSAGKAFLDVGTSTVGREPNFGLIMFKSRLGFRPSPKSTLRLQL